MKEPLYLKIIDDLRQRIECGALPIDSMLPSVSELRKKYKVSHITVLRAFKELAEQNLIVRRPGRGYQVSVQSAEIRKMRNFGLFFRNISTRMFDQYFNGIMAAIQHYSAFKQIGLYFSPTASIQFNLFESKNSEKLLPEARSMSHQVEGFFFDERLDDEEIKKILLSTQKPGVLLNRYSDCPKILSVYPDLATEWDRLYAMLQRLNYQYFVFCDSGANNFSQQVERKCFHKMLNSYQIPPENYTILTQLNSLTREEICHQIFQQLQNHHGERTVFICPEDNFARYVINFLRNRNLLPPRDYGIVGCFGQDSSQISPELATIKVNTEQLGKTAVDILLAQINGQMIHVDDLAVPCEFIFGETI